MIHPVHGYWMPDLSDKQRAIWDNTACYQLVSGPVMTGKSYGVEHKIVRHMWDTPGARVGAFSRTVKTAKEGGSYEDLTGIIVPHWMTGNLVGDVPGVKFGYTKEPHIAGDTRTNSFRLANRYGGESTFYLFSLDYDDDIEAKIKQMRFSCIWFIELSNFGQGSASYKIWQVTSNRLFRMAHLRTEQYLWIADTNPSEEGEDSWIYKLFYEKHGFDSQEHRWTIDNLSVVEIMIDDNPYLNKTQKDIIKAQNAHDPALYARNVNGKWVGRSGSGLFTDFFLPNTHVQGDASSPNSENWDVIQPGPDAFQFVCGWDLGAVHHSFHMACLRVCEHGNIYDIIGELTALEDRTSVREFTDEVMRMILYWEEFMLREYGKKEIKWRHWSDSSSWNFSAGLGYEEEKLVYSVSEGKIQLDSIAKPKGSVQKRVELTQRLLFENRMFISAHLTRTIQMFRKIKRGTGAKYVSETGGHKHLFDSLTYLVIGEEPIAVAAQMPEVKRFNSGLIMVPA